MSLEVWLNNLLKEFRLKYQELSPSRQKHVQNIEDLTAPCQIEVLWVNKGTYNMQLLIFTHDSDLPDMDIKIHGPYLIREQYDNEFGYFPDIEEIDEIESLIYQERFDDKTSKSIERNFLTYIRQIDSSQESPIINTREMLGSMEERKFLWALHGKIQDINLDKFISLILRDRSEEIAANKSYISKLKEIEAKTINGFGIYVFPPIWIGEIPKFSLKYKIKREIFRELKNFISSIIKEFYKERILIVENDGYFAIGESNKDKAFELINEIVSIIAFKNGLVYSIKKYELSPLQIHVESKEIHGAGYMGKGIELHQLRYKPFSNDIEFKRTIISEQAFIQIIRDAENYTQDEKLSIVFRVFLDSFTHLRNIEYSQSFILSWTIIEQFIEYVWEKMITDLNIQGKRKKKLIKKPNYLTADHKLEILEMKNYIDNNDYDILMKLKTARNKFMHNLKPISKESAELSFNLSKNLMQRMINEII